MFCREQVAGFRSRQAELDGAGVGLVFIGNGNPAMATDFREHFAPQAQVWVDTRLESYALLGFRKDLGSTFNLGVLRSGFRAMASGNRQGATKGNPWQQGGVVVMPAGGGSPAFVYASKAAGDHPPLDEVIRAAVTLAKTAAA